MYAYCTVEDVVFNSMELYSKCILVLSMNEEYGAEQQTVCIWYEVGVQFLVSGFICLHLEATSSGDSDCVPSLIIAANFAP